MNMYIVSQMKEVGTEVIKNVSAIDDPVMKILLLGLIGAIGALVWTVVYLWRQKVGDIGDDKETLKKKEEQIQRAEARLIDLIEKSFTHSTDLKLAIAEFSTNIKIMSDSFNRDISAIESKLEAGHSFFKEEIVKIKERINIVCQKANQNDK